MKKTILITGSTDGIGLETAKALYGMGHTILLHGRSAEKLATAKLILLEMERNGVDNDAGVYTYLADLSSLSDTVALADKIQAEHSQLDVLINNAGIFVSKGGLTQDGFELRFAVNAIAPYVLTKKLLPMLVNSELGHSGRVVNLSSAAQATVDTSVIKSAVRLSDNSAYAQSKLLLTMWSRKLGLSLAETGPVVVSVNPKSLLGSKMVKDAYGVAGGDLKIGADILIRAALSAEFSQAHGLYFDNDIGRFANPHPDALNDSIVNECVARMDDELSDFLK